MAGSALSFAALAHADWLAADPGTPISLQVNVNGDFVVRPIGGTWSHPLCSDTSAAELDRFSGGPAYVHNRDLLIAAAAHGSIVNIFAYADECDEHGHPLIRIIRIQGV